MRNNVYISYKWKHLINPKLNDGEILVDSIKEMNEVTILRMLERILVYTFKRGRKCKRKDRLKVNEDKWDSYNWNHIKYDKGLEFHSKWIDIDYGLIGRLNDDERNMCKWYYHITIYNDTINHRFKFYPLYYKNETVIGLENLFIKLINECKEYDDKKLNEILPTILLNKWKYYDIKNYDEFEKRMYFIEEMVYYKLCKRKWEKDNTKWMFENEEKKEWGRLTNNKLWNYKVKNKS